jgi:hypothetical protein
VRPKPFTGGEPELRGHSDEKHGALRWAGGLPGALVSWQLEIQDVAHVKAQRRIYTNLRSHPVDYTGRFHISLPKCPSWQQVLSWFQPISSFFFNHYRGSLPTARTFSHLFPYSFLFFCICLYLFSQPFSSHIPRSPRERKFHSHTMSIEKTPAVSLPAPDYYQLEDLSEHLDTERLLEHDTDAESLQPKPKHADGPVTWMSLPRKDQLAILFICRLVDFLQVASLQAYVFYQLRSLDNTKSDSEISTQAGILQGSFTGAQVLTAVLWGKAADASWCGRKMVLVIGLLGTAVSCLGYGFATSFYWAVFWRALGGGINGLVGIM